MAANSNKSRSRELSPGEQLQADIVAAAERNELDGYIKFLRPLLDASSRAPWRPISVATAIHRLGKCEGNINDVPDLAGFFKLLTTQVRALKEPCGSQELGNALYGLNQINSVQLEPDARAALVHLLNALVDEAKRCREEFGSEEIGMAFYGLRGISTEHLGESHREVVADVLAILARKTKACGEVFTAQNIGMAFYGLQKIRTADLDDAGQNALAKVLTELAHKLSTCREELTSQAVLEIFCGLRNIDTSTFNDAGRQAMRIVLESLANKIQASTQWFRSDDLDSAFEVLAEITSGTPDEPVREAVANLQVVLTEKLKTKTEGIRLETVAKAVSSLQKCDLASLPANLRARLATVLGNLADASARCLSSLLNARSIVAAYGGLQGMETAYLDDLGRKALVRLLKVLADNTRECRQRFDATQVGMAFSGLQGIDIAGFDDYGRNVVRETLEALATKAAASSEPLSYFSFENVFVGIRGFLPGTTCTTTCKTTAAVQAQAIDTAKIVLSHMTGKDVQNASQARTLVAVLQALHQTDAPEVAVEKQVLQEKLDAFWVGHSSSGLRADEDFLPALLESQQTYAVCGRPLPAGLSKSIASHKIECERLSSPAPRDKEIQWELEELLNVPVQLNKLVEGFRLYASFTVDGRLYDLEIERNTHLKQIQRLSDGQRDAYLRSRGYVVIRMPLGRTTQQIAEQVLEHVTSRPQPTAAVSHHAQAAH